MSQEINQYKIFLAALLHDIGKFYQRSGRGQLNKDNLARLLEGKHDSHFGYEHIAWTAAFFELTKETVFAKITEGDIPVFGDDDFNLENEESLISLASRHHFPKTEHQSLIQLADIWASGHARNEKRSLETFEKINSSPLVPIFSSLIVNKTPFPASLSLGYPVAPLELNGNIFPVSKAQVSLEYGPLWDMFLKDLIQLPKDSIKGFTESLVFLLRRYISQIPTNTTSDQNISLFEHSKATAAIASALYQFSEQEENSGIIFDKDTLKVDKSICPLLLFCGDLSGIQDFIYQISNRRAAMSLKGRSFYLQLLIESVIQQIMDATDTTPAHVVYSSGGKFFIILPNTASTLKSLVDIEKSVIDRVYAKHGTSLYVCMGMVPFGFDEKGKVFAHESTIDGEKVDNMALLWKATVEKAAEKKSQKYAHILTRSDVDFENFFGAEGKGIEPVPAGNDTVVCGVTGEITHKSQAKILDKSVEEDERVYVKNSIYEQAELGKVLKDSDYFIAFRKEKVNNPPKNTIDPGDLGFLNYMFDKKDLITTQSAFRNISSPLVSRVKRINNTEFAQISHLKGRKAAYGFLFYGGNHQAETPDRTYTRKRASGKVDNFNSRKTFEELVLDPEASQQNFKRLGVLRMDVDGLGKIFIDGLPDEQKTFAAYASLSNQLDLFFAGYLNIIRSRVDQKQGINFKDFVNILYSGGDDVFAVGRWDQLLLFAEEVRKDLRKFVGGWENISISGGITLVGEKFPISKSAEMAGEAEKMAKSFQQKEVNKNAMNVFGVNLSWEEEFSFVKIQKQVFIQWYDSELISKNTLNQIMRFWRMKNEGMQDWLWLSAYFFARRDKNEAYNALKQLILTGRYESTIVEAGRALDLLAVAARWADFTLRNRM